MKLIIFRPTGEVRQAQLGEWFVDSYGAVFEQRILTCTLYAHPIFTRHEVDATPEILQALGMEG